MSEREQVGWIDEFGNCFPLNAWQTTYHDDGKGRWKPLYTAPQSAAALRSQVAALRDVLERVLKALDDEAKSESTLESAEANFSSTASDRRRYENALIETGNALKSARTILEATQ